MKSNLYNKIVFDEIYKGNISSNYFYKVGRELKIFSEYNNKLFYVESKIHRIMEDYAFNDKILWKKNPTGNVLYNKKNDTISLSDFNIENNFNTFLSDIPYFIALHFYKEIKYV